MRKDLKDWKDLKSKDVIIYSYAYNNANCHSTYISYIDFVDEDILLYMKDVKKISGAINTSGKLVLVKFNSLWDMNNFKVIKYLGNFSKYESIEEFLKLHPQYFI